MTLVSGWGGVAGGEHTVVPLRDRLTVAERIASTDAPGLAFGMGRSYGDEALNTGGTLWTTTGLDRLISFDPATGVLRAEAGVLLETIQRVFAPRGWMLPVTPGTRFVTLGGAIANDVHGKNHAGYGSFGEHVLGFTLARTDGTVIECSPEVRPEWFRATVAGMGLTGVIVEATLQLKPVPGEWIDVEDVAFRDLDEFSELTMVSDAEGWEYTVAWVDVLSDGGRGRGIFSRGSASRVNGGRAPGAGVPGAGVPGGGLLRVPFRPPLSAVNGFTTRVFSEGYFAGRKVRTGRRRRVHYLPFFYPLDAIRNWNLMYGPRGFFQYQSVVPFDGGLEATKRQFREIAASGEGSFLTVLKTFGDRPSAGMLGFPMAGITLAVDFPNRGARTLALFDRLDAIVRSAGGRLYAGKDARMSRSMYEAGYPGLDAFREFRDPGIDSDLARRLID